MRPANGINAGTISFGHLPATGFIRQSVLIGESAVSEEAAERNRDREKGPRRARSGLPGILPWSSATLWRKVGRGEFPAPIKLSEKITAWRVEDIRAWLDAQATPPSVYVPIPRKATTAVQVAKSVSATDLPTAPTTPDPPPKRGPGRPRKVAGSAVPA
jgi:hypothetical protein